MNFLVAKTITKLMLLGCGREKSFGGAIEVAIDEGIFDVSGVEIDRNIYGYIKDPRASAYLEKLVVEKLIDPKEFERISQQFELPLPGDLFPVSVYLEEA